MKKGFITVLVIISIIFGTVCTVAETEGSWIVDEVQKEDIETRYTYFSTTTIGFDISGNTLQWTFKANKAKQYDVAYLTAILYKNSGAIMSRTSVYYNTNINDSKSLTLTAHGTYYS